MGSITDLRAEVRAELRAEIAPSRKRWSSTCPVCGDSFTRAADVTPWVTDCCQESCQLELENFMHANPDLTNAECVAAMRDAQ